MRKWRKKIKSWLRDHPEVDRWIEWAKSVSIPGFEGVPMFYVLHFFFNEIKDDKINIRASSVAFFFILAIFPGVIFFFTLIPYIPIADFQNILFNTLQQVMPQSAFDMMQGAILDILKQERVDLLSVGFILAFLFSTNGAHALSKSFSKSHELFKKRSFIKQRLTDIKLTAVLAILLVLSVVLVVLGNQVLHGIMNFLSIQEIWQIYLISIFRWIIIIAVFYFGISFIYYYAPATRKKFKLNSIGATVATFISVGVSILFSFVVNNYNLYNEIYGSIGALLALLLWIYFNCMSLIIGFELNTSVKYLKMTGERQVG